MRNTLRLWAAGFGVALLLAGFVGGRSAVAAPTTGEDAWLGVYLQDLTPELREGLSYKGDGVLVRRVVDGSPAAKAGVRQGDVVVKVNSRAITSQDQLMEMVQASKVGQVVTLQVNRKGTVSTLTATLAARPEDGDEDSDDDDEDNDNDHRAPHIEIEGDDWGHVDLPDGMTMMRLGRGRLGVRIQNLNADLGPYFGVKDGKGVVVLEVLKDTPAEKAGLKAGDVITQVDSEKVDDSDDLVSALRDEDGKVSIGVVRHGTRRTVEAELEKSDRRTVRIHRGDGPMGFRYNGPKSWTFAPTPDHDDMRKELEDLREELKDLKKELKDMKK